MRGVLDPTATGVELAAASLDPRLRLAACPRRSRHTRSRRAAISRACSRGFRVRVAPAGPCTCRSRSAARTRCWYCAAHSRAARRSAPPMSMRRLASCRDSPRPTSSRIEDLAGRLTKRPLPAGSLLSADALSAALLIHRGQEVTLTRGYQRLRGARARSGARRRGGPAARARPEPVVAQDCRGSGRFRGCGAGNSLNSDRRKYSTQQNMRQINVFSPKESCRRAVICT